MDKLLFSQRLIISNLVEEKKKELLRTNPDYTKTSDIAFTIIVMDKLGLFDRDKVRELCQGKPNPFADMSKRYPLSLLNEEQIETLKSEGGYIEDGYMVMEK
jgi:hypothetical protein